MQVTMAVVVPGTRDEDTKKAHSVWVHRSLFPPDRFFFHLVVWFCRGGFYLLMVLFTPVGCINNSWFCFHLVVSFASHGVVFLPWFCFCLHLKKKKKTRPAGFVTSGGFIWLLSTLWFSLHLMVLFRGFISTSWFSFPLVDLFRGFISTWWFCLTGSCRTSCAWPRGTSVCSWRSSNWSAALCACPASDHRSRMWRQQRLNKNFRLLSRQRQGAWRRDRTNPRREKSYFWCSFYAGNLKDAHEWSLHF